MQELWQLYTEDGQPVPGQGAIKNDIYTKGLLHGSAHVWIYLQNGANVEVLLQKRGANKRTWPNLYDISAAGHIDIGEEPLTTALRETKEEIGLDITAADLKLIKLNRVVMLPPNGETENEFQWIYLLRLDQIPKFILEKSEVDSLLWKPLGEFEKEVFAKPQLYVSHTPEYFQTVINAIKKALV